MSESRRSTLGFALLLVVAVVLAYANSLHGPFVLDDASSIVGNPTIRQLDSLAVLVPPSHLGLTVEARPVLNLSLALNYAVAGAAVEGYHVGNLLIHALCALTLFGLLRRTFHDGLAAFAAALLWALHPLDTSAVTYVIQRAESLMALFYLLTLYCLVRLARSEGSRVWAVGGVLACAAGMATKEVMVSAPLAALLYDAVFLSEGVGAALRRRPRFYAGLALTWGMVAALALASGGRGGTSGFASGVGPFKYWITQPAAVLHYLRLVVWPSPLVFDYGTPWIEPWTAGLPPLIVVTVLIGFAVTALRRRSPAGFALALLFLVLAPTSLVPGNRQVLAEHRMYLALVGGAVLVAWGLTMLTGFSRRIASVLAILLAPALGGLTYARNEVYRSALRLYGSDVSHQPDNPYALTNYSTALIGAHRYPEAEAYARRALQLKPSMADAQNNLGSALMRRGQIPEAEAAYRAALAINPDFTAAHLNLAVELVQEGRATEAVVQAQMARALDPFSPEIDGDLGAALAAAGRPAEGEAALRRALRADPTLALAHLNLGILLTASDRAAEAVTELQAAVRLDPDNALAQASLGQAHARLGQSTQAVVAYREALRLSPRFAEAHERLGNELLREGLAPDAIREYAEAVTLSPTVASYHYNLANGLLRNPGGKNREAAVRELREALRREPGLQPARDLLQRLGETE